MNFPVDMDAECQVFAASIYPMISDHLVLKPRAKLVSYSKHRIRPCAKTTLLCLYKDTYHKSGAEIPMFAGVTSQTANANDQRDLPE